MQLEVFIALAPLLLAVLVVERYVTSRARARIPIVVHVNGTRGKSSVTRLIAAGLRAGGVRTWAKVTGTLPRLIDEDGQDVPIVRHSPASISEQRAVVVAASAAGVQALVVECMALKPVYQRVSEDGMLHASSSPPRLLRRVAVRGCSGPNVLREMASASSRQCCASARLP